jgi:hypothetical protein
MADYTWEKICENITVPTFNSEKEEVFIVYDNKIHLFDDEKHYYLDEDNSSFVEHELPTKGGKYKLVQHYDSDTHQYVIDSETGANYFNALVNGENRLKVLNSEDKEHYFYPDWNGTEWKTSSDSYLNGNRVSHKFIFFNDHLYDFTEYKKENYQWEGIKPLENITGDYYTGDTILESSSFNQYSVYDNYIIGTGYNSSDIDGWMTGYGFYDAEKDDFSVDVWDRDNLDNVILIIYKDQIFFLNNEGYNNRKANVEVFLDAQYGADFTEIGADDLNFYYACIFNDSIYAIVKNENSYDIYRYHEPTQYPIMSFSDTKKSFKNIKKYIDKKANIFANALIYNYAITVSENNTKVNFEIEPIYFKDLISWNSPDGEIEVTLYTKHPGWDNGSYLNFKLPAKNFIGQSLDGNPDNLDYFIWQGNVKIKITIPQDPSGTGQIGTAKVEVSNLPTEFYQSGFKWEAMVRYRNVSE